MLPVVTCSRVLQLIDGCVVAVAQVEEWHKGHSLNLKPLESTCPSVLERQIGPGGGSLARECT